MNSLGWYSGDLHTHRNPEEMPLLARAEELNIAPVITRHVGDGRAAKPAFHPHTLSGSTRSILSACRTRKWNGWAPGTERWSC